MSKKERDLIAINVFNQLQKDSKNPRNPRAQISMVLYGLREIFDLLKLTRTNNPDKGVISTKQDAMLGIIHSFLKRDSIFLMQVLSPTGIFFQTAITDRDIIRYPMSFTRDLINTVYDTSPSDIGGILILLFQIFKNHEKADAIQEKMKGIVKNALTDNITKKWSQDSIHLLIQSPHTPKEIKDFLKDELDQAFPKVTEKPISPSPTPADERPTYERSPFYDEAKQVYAMTESIASAVALIKSGWSIAENYQKYTLTRLLKKLESFEEKFDLENSLDSLNLFFLDLAEDQSIPPAFTARINDLKSLKDAILQTRRTLQNLKDRRLERDIAEKAQEEKASNRSLEKHLRKKKSV